MDPVTNATAVEDEAFFNGLVGDDFDMFLPPIEPALMDDSAGPPDLPLGSPTGTDDGAGHILDLPPVKTEEEEEEEEGEEGDLMRAPVPFDAMSTTSSSTTMTKQKTKAPKRGNKSGITTKGAATEEEKIQRRRKQIAAASRASRARRKRELEDLREENQRLREERAQFLSKIGRLQAKVESMRERGSTDMRVENALLRAQLEEHKRFVSCFKSLCDGAPTTSNARHNIYKSGSDSAQAQVLGLISQSLADHWLPGITPPEARIPYQNFRWYYKFKDEYGERPGHSSQPGGTLRQRLNVRVDLTFPGFQASGVSDFMWNSFSNADMQQRLYRVQNIELTQLADDMPDKDTKMVYYREKLEAPKKDQDWVVLCNRRTRPLAKSTLVAPSGDDIPSQQQQSDTFFTGIFGAGSTTSQGPPTKRLKTQQNLGKTDAIVLAMSTTQHSAPQFDNANRITSMFVQGTVTWNSGADARVIVVFSFPDDFKIKAMEGFNDVVLPDGTMGLKFAEVVKEFNEMLGEAGSGDGFVL